MSQEFNGPVFGGSGKRDVNHNKLTEQNIHANTVNIHISQAEQDSLEAARNLLSAYSKPRNEHGLPASQPVILGPDATLTTEQRRTLNEKVKQLECEFGQSGKAIWQTLHRIMGTANIGEMTQRHYAPADTILDKLHQIATLESQLTRQQATEQTIDSLRQHNEQLSTENVWLRKRTQQPCTACQDKDRQLSGVRQQLTAAGSVALIAVITAGFLGWPA